jgi:cytochrome c oxidase cbb3-type subunit 3
MLLIQKARMKTMPLFRKMAMFLLISMMMFSELFAQNGSSKLSSSINNTFVISTIILMIIFLLIIGLLANVLIGAARYRAGIDLVDAVSQKKVDGVESNSLSKAILSILLLFAANHLFAQEEKVVLDISSHVAGLSNTAFYFIVGVLAIQLLVIMVLVLQLRSVIQTEKSFVKKAVPLILRGVAWKNFWGRVNAFKPRERESELDIGHDYDGIRELDNRLPPWWLYGFYLTIIVGAVYMWRYHVAETAPLSIGELELAMKQAAVDHEAYLKRSASLVDENTVTLLTDAEALMAGKKIFEINCAACHGKAGEGTVGPNLTDEYWMHGGSIKDVFKTIKYGWSEKGMKSWKDDLSPVQIAQISTYIKSIAGTNPPNAKEKQGEFYKETSATGINSDSLKVEGKTVVTTE